MDIKKSLGITDVKDGITGPKMAEYLRQIAAAIEDSNKLFTAKIKITVISKP